MSEATARLQAVIASLSDQEQLAVHEAVRRELAQRSTRYRVIGPELLIGKPADPAAAATRQLRALVVDYDNQVNLEFLLQPGGEIVESSPIDWQPPFAPEEIDEARQIAESDARVARSARQAGLSVLPFGPAQPRTGTPRAMPRLIGLRYIVTVETRTRVVQAVINLSTRTLGDVEEIEP
jgi:hypothetical protein